MNHLLLEVTEAFLNDTVMIPEATNLVLMRIRELTNATFVRVVVGEDENLLASIGAVPENIGEADLLCATYARENHGNEAVLTVALADFPAIASCVPDPTQVVVLRPLIGRGRYLGLVWAGYDDIPQISEDDALVVSILIKQLSLAIANRRQTENMMLFLQTVSHDLRSPLTAAKGFVDMMPMVGAMSDKQVVMKDKVITSIIDMTNLVEKVLDAGRLDPEMGAYELRRDTTDPKALIEKVVSNLSDAARKKALHLKSNIADNIPIMFIDGMMLERALMNLVENAIKYTPLDGEIVVRAQVENDTLVLTVEDNGYGIPQDMQATIFDRGSRVRREEHRKVRGSGLGLFIVKNVAQQHGGMAYLYSTEGEGSIFQIQIPINEQNMTRNT